MATTRSKAARLLKETEQSLRAEPTAAISHNSTHIKDAMGVVERLEKLGIASGKSKAEEASPTIPGHYPRTPHVQDDHEHDNDFLHHDYGTGHQQKAGLVSADGFPSRSKAELLSHGQGGALRSIGVVGNTNRPYPVSCDDENSDYAHKGTNYRTPAGPTRRTHDNTYGPRCVSSKDREEYSEDNQKSHKTKTPKRSSRKTKTSSPSSSSLDSSSESEDDKERRRRHRRERRHRRHRRERRRRSPSYSSSSSSSDSEGEDRRYNRGHHHRRRDADKTIKRKLLDSVPRYDGSGGAAKFNVFVTRFEAYQEIANHSEKGAVLLASQSLVGDAAIWWFARLRAGQEEPRNAITTWNEFKHALRTQFLPEDIENRLWKQLLACKLHTFKSVMDFNIAFTRLALQLSSRYPSDLIVDTYIDNLTERDGSTSSSLRTHVLANPMLMHSDLDTVMRFTQRIQPVDDKHKPKDTGGRGSSSANNVNKAKGDTTDTTASDADAKHTDSKRKTDKKRSGNRGSRGGGNRGGRGGHDNSNADRTPPPCQYCGEAHWHSKCPVLAKLREEQQRKQRGQGNAVTDAARGTTDGANSHSRAASACSEDPTPASSHHADLKNDVEFEDIELIVDSGTTDHTHGNGNIIVNQRQSGRKVHLANDSVVIAEHVGTMAVRTSTGHNLDLIDVLHVPGIAPLFSVSSATLHGLSVHFWPEGVMEIKDNDVTVAKGFRRNRLFYLRLKIRKVPRDYRTLAGDTVVTSAEAESHIASAYHAIAMNAETMKIHRRFGHIGERNLRRIYKDLLDSSLGENELPFCDACALGKAKRLPYPTSTKKYEPLERIDVDLAGPFVLSANKIKYTYTVTERFSRHATTYFLRGKNDGVPQYVDDYITTMERKFNRKIVQHHSDLGGEFTGAEYADVLSSRGITATYATRQCPSQNGMAERIHRTIAERVRAIMIDAHLPSFLWEDIWRTVIWIYNRTPHSHNEAHRSPLATLNLSCGVRDDSADELRMLRTPGCVAFMHVPKDERTHKLGPTGIKAIYLGPATQTKGYRLWNPISNAFFERRDVVFDEDRLYEPKEFGMNPDGTVDGNFYDHGDLSPLRIIAHREGDHGLEFQVIWVDADGENTWEPYDNLSLHHDTLQRYCLQNGIDAPVTTFSSIHHVGTGNAEFLPVFIPEPKSFTEAMHQPDAAKWKDACQLEYDNLRRMSVFTLVPRPKHANIVSTKWVFKRKLRADHSVDKYRARWVARGFSQRPGLDYDDTYAPVASYSSMRLIVGLAARHQWSLEQTDIPVAYLNAGMDKPVHAEQPEGFVDNQHPDFVCLLLRCLYGLKQSAHRWNLHIVTYFQSRGFVALSGDACIFILRRHREGDVNDSEGAGVFPACIIVLYVDDITITGANPTVIDEEKKALSDAFPGSTWSKADFFLRNRILRHVDGSISIDQQHHIESALQRFGLADSNPVRIPMDVNAQLQKRQENDGVADKALFQEMIGTALYIAGCTRPDISFAVSRLSRYSADPTTIHIACAKRIFRYLKATKELGLVYSSNGECNIEGYVDSDWASDAEDRRSQTGYLFKIAGGVIHWRSTKQKAVALSSTEAEFIAASECARDAIWLRRMINKIVNDDTTPIPVHIDNSGAKALADGSMGSGRTKHIDVRCQFTRQAVVDGVITMQRVSTLENTADTLTKALPRLRFEGCREEMGLRRIVS